MRPLQQQGTCLGERYNIEEQIQFLYMLGQGAELGELEQVELDRLFITCYELTGKDGQKLSEEAFWIWEMRMLRLRCQNSTDLFWYKKDSA